MKTLIVYYSMSHNNEILARYLAKKLNCDIFRIEETKRRNGFTILLDIVFNRTPAINQCSFPVEDYSNLILIAPVWAGKIATPMKSFLLKERGRINRFSFITICGGREAQRDTIVQELANLAKLEPDNVVELWINDILPAAQKDTIKGTSDYRITEKDLEFYEKKIGNFLQAEAELLEY